jgi:hypothetical protein
MAEEQAEAIAQPVMTVSSQHPKSARFEPADIDMKTLLSGESRTEPIYLRFRAKFEFFSRSAISNRSRPHNC